jgi:hypothetical protein
MTSLMTAKHRMLVSLTMVAGLIAAAAFIWTAPAAAAPNTVYTDPATGNARFAAYGDHMYVCDEAEDGHSVGVYLDYTKANGDYVTEWRFNWDGPYKYNGCKDINLNVHEDTQIFYKVCLADHAKPGGQEPDVITGSCSDLVYATA